MVEISSSGSGEGPGWVTAPGYSTAAKFPGPMTRYSVDTACQAERGASLRRARVGARREMRVGNMVEAHVRVRLDVEEHAAEEEESDSDHQDESDPRECAAQQHDVP